MTLQEMLKEERQEGRQEGRQESLTIVRQVNSGELTLEEGADELEISVDELREIMGAHPKAASVVDQKGNA